MIWNILETRSTGQHARPELDVKRIVEYLKLPASLGYGMTHVMRIHHKVDKWPHLLFMLKIGLDRLEFLGFCHGVDVEQLLQHVSTIDLEKIRKLSISVYNHGSFPCGCYKFNDTKIQELLISNLPSLQEFQFSGMNCGPFLVNLLAKNCPELTKIGFYYTYLDDDGVACLWKDSVIKELTSLHLLETKVTSVGLHSILGNLRHLEILTGIDNYVIHGLLATIAGIAPANEKLKRSTLVESWKVTLPNIKTWTMNFGEIHLAMYNKFLPVLFPDLCDVTMTISDNKFPLQELKFLGALIKLRNLTLLAETEPISWKDIVSVLRVDIGHQLTKFQLYNVKDFSTRTFTRTFPHLKAFRLEKVRGFRRFVDEAPAKQSSVTRLAFQAIPSGLVKDFCEICPNLRTLSTENEPQLTDALITGNFVLTNLKFFNLGCQRHEFNNRMTEFVLHCPNLKVLNLGSSRQRPDFKQIRGVSIVTFCDFFTLLVAQWKGEHMAPCPLCIAYGLDGDLYHDQ